VRAGGPAIGAVEDARALEASRTGDEAARLDASDGQAGTQLLVALADERRLVDLPANRLKQRDPRCSTR